MRKNWTSMVLAAALVAVGIAGPVASYAQSSGSDSVIDVDFRDAPMRDAVRELMRLTGLSIVFESSDKEFPDVDLSLKGVTAEDALRYVCQSVGVYLRKDDNGVFIISRIRPEEKKPTSTGAPAPEVKKKVYKIHLQRADAETVYNYITKGIVFDPVKGFVEMNRMYDSVTMSNRGLKTYDVFSKDDTVNRPTSTTANPKPLNGLEASDSIVLPGEGAAQRPGGGGGGQLGGGALGGQLGGGGQGGNLGGGGLGQGGQGGNLSGGQGLIPELDYITFDPNDNSIIIRATEREWQDLQSWIEQWFDFAPRQVTIRVQFVTTTSSNSRSLGFDWLYARGGFVTGNAPGSFAQSADPIFLAWQSGNIQTRLRTYIQDGHGKVVSSPTIRTMNNQPAFVRQGVVTYFFVPILQNGPGGVVTTYSPQQLQAESILFVRPRINADDTVTVYLTPSIQQFGQIRTSPDGSFAVPDISYQQIALVARVRNGETIVLAGFNQRTTTGQNKKFPVLGDLPVIGQLFRQFTREQLDSELLIFVTPTIEPEDDNPLGS